MNKKAVTEKMADETTMTSASAIENTQEMVSVAEEKSKKEQQIYIGPNLPGGFLAQHTVFRDGFPKHLEDILKKYPQVKLLIVPISQLLEAQDQLRRQGTAVQQAYQALGRKEQAYGI